LIELSRRYPFEVWKPAPLPSQRSKTIARPRRIWLVLAALLGVLVAMPGGTQTVAGSHRAPVSATARSSPAERSAQAEARASGRKVEVLPARTEYAQLFANPDGTFSYKASPVPQRIERPDGSWSSIDTTLQRQPNGSVAPVASPAGLVASGGGIGSLFSVSHGGKQLSFSWPGGALPSPSLSGDTATYASVLPGVDLLLIATSTGASEVLVVHDARASANPALATLTFGLAASGLSVSADSAGNLTAADPAGSAVFDVPAPRMWDSTGGHTGAGAPGPRSHQAAPGVRLEVGTLTVSPQPALLTGADTVYPVYIDPEVTQHGPQSGWLDVGRDNGSGSWGDWEPSDARAGVWCSPDQNGNCGPAISWGEYRTYFNFPVPSQIWDSGQISATLFANETWSWTCSAKTTVELWQTSWASPGATWNSRPTENQWQSSQTVAYGNTCAAHGVSFDASGAAKQASSNHWGAVTLELRAAGNDENNWNVNSWKRFAVSRNADPYIVINYVHAPEVPTDAATLDGTRSIGCSTSATWISNTGPSLQAKVTDRDGGNVSATFHYSKTVTGTPSGKPTLSGASGSVFHVQIPPGTLTDGTYWWHAWGSVGALQGSASPICEFSVDTSRPSTPTITSDLYTSGQATNTVGTVGSFTFSDPGNKDPFDGVNDVVGYRYGFTNPPVNYVAATSEGGPATVKISPVWLGQQTLYVQAVDRAGNLSPDDLSANPPAEFNIATIRPPGNPTPLMAWWKLAEGTGTTAADATGNGHDATVTPDAGWSAGRVSGAGALSLTGASDSEAVAAVPAVDNTGSFTVSTWVKLSPACASSPSTCGFFAAVSQDGITQSGFALEYVDQRWCGSGTGDGVHGCWSFTMPSSDTTSPTPYRAEATTPVSFGTWVHLTGVYDQPHQQIQIYVNGQPASLFGASSGVQPWAGPAMGPLRIGRVLFNGGAYEFWPGEVSETCAFWGALDAIQVLNVYNGGCGSAGAP
jgi:hypothetical protein